MSALRPAADGTPSVVAHQVKDLVAQDPFAWAVKTADLDEYLASLMPFKKKVSELLRKAKLRVPHEFMDFDGTHTTTCPACALEDAILILNQDMP